MRNKFTIVQVRKIDIDKWCEGYELNRDPGLDYIVKWIDNNAAWFRNAWNKSLCQECQHWRNCGHQVLDGCEFFSNEKELS
jgi:hypothetical protein